MILHVENLTKTYKINSKQSGIKALDDISFQISEGEFVGIMGPSGSGKSTALKLIGGVCQPTSGFVEIAEKKLNELSDDELALFRRKNLGFVFQDFNMMDGLTLKENILLPMILEKRSIIEMENRAQDMMTYFGIYDLKDKYIYQVSGGQLQKAAICRALMNNPNLILADEPTGSLDSKSSYDVMNSFTKCIKEKKTTILMVTHDPFAASFCNRIIFIKDGKKSNQIVNKGTRKEFFDIILENISLLEGNKDEF